MALDGDNRSIDSFVRQFSVVLIICCLSFFFVVEGTKCYKEEALGDRDGNVYYCEEEGKTECCEEDKEYTCCESQATRTWKEQLVGGLVLLITLLCCYFWRDNFCSKSDTSLAQSCCTCCKKPENEDREKLAAVTQPGPSAITSFSPRPWRFGGPGIVDDDRLSPAPAFHFKQPTYKKY